MKMTIDEFKKYYEKYYADLMLDKEEIDQEVEDWSYYRNLIMTGEIDAFRYNSVKENFADDEYKSLQYFIERQTGGVGGFGSMVSGKLVLWIDGVGSEAVWHNRKKDANGSFQDTILENDSDKNAFFNEIKDYLKQLTTKYSFDELVYFLTDPNNLTHHFGPANFLEKMIIFNSWLDELPENTGIEPESQVKYDYNKKLVFIYDFSEIEQLNLMDGRNDLFAQARTEPVNIKKNKLIVDVVLNVLGITNPDIYDLVKIEKCLWNLTYDSDRETILSNERKNVIFYGAPGTGKTFKVKKALDANSDIEYTIVQFHPSFAYEDFIEGIKPVGIDSNGNLKFSIVNGCFKNLCIKAKNNPEKQYYFVADEINRANLSSVFGETLSLLEDDYRWENDGKSATNLRSTPLSGVIKKIYEDAIKSNEEEKINEAKSLIFYQDDETNEVFFGIPKNVHFIGMMNDVDKSIDTFDLALRRRFVWIRKDFDAGVLASSLKERGVGEKSANSYLSKCINLNYFITGFKYDGVTISKEPLNLGKSFEFGHAIFMKIPDEYIGRKRIINEGRAVLWKEHLEPTLREYLRTSLVEAKIDTAINDAKDIFCK